MSQKVYLAGGMNSEWRARVEQNCKGLAFINPVDKERNQSLTLDEYAIWDIHHIKLADIVFGYMERTNPSGIGLACEIGVAYGLGKTVILVLEDNHHCFDDKYLAFMKKVAHITFQNLDEGIMYLDLFGIKSGFHPV